MTSKWTTPIMTTYTWTLQLAAMTAQREMMTMSIIFPPELTNTYPLEVLQHRSSFELPITDKEQTLLGLYFHYLSGEYTSRYTVSRLQSYCDKGVNQEYEPEQVTTNVTYYANEAVSAAQEVIARGALPDAHKFAWLNVFSPSSLRIIIDEITESYEDTGYTANGLANRDALVYGWYVRATAAKSCAVFDSSPPLVPDETVVTNDNGGSQSHTGTRFDLLPYSALDIIAQVLYSGAIKYGDNNWKRIPTHEHLNHALRHLLRFGLTGDTEELSHGACRALFALTIHIEGVHTDDTN